MFKSLKYISISQKTANTEQREYYHLDDELRRGLAKRIKITFPDLSGLMLLSTCNRTEIYFESTETTSSRIRDYLIDLFNPFQANQKSLFTISDQSSETAQHLLEVANGLASAVVGDGQILAQIKEAYHFSLSRSLQGSLLERAVQAVFRSHKRISNETSFRNGSKSTSYRALKLIEQQITREQLSDKNLLIIGAGEISIEILKYLHKFPFKTTTIANRTTSKALQLADIYQLQVLPWTHVEANELQEFDAIITAVSNRKDLIHRSSGGNQVLVDLALPSNVSPSLANDSHISLFNLDQVTEQIDQTDSLQQDAISRVQEILNEELRIFNRWVSQSDFREQISHHKSEYTDIIQQEILSSYPDLYTSQQAYELATSIANKLVREQVKSLQEKSITNLKVA